MDLYLLFVDLLAAVCAGVLAALIWLGIQQHKYGI